MVDEVYLNAVRADAEILNVTLRISTPPSVVRVKCGDEEDWRTYEGVDLLECLKEIRRDLEGDGFLLCCQGARRDVFTSGMTRQMTDGRLAYSLRPREMPTDDDLVDIFAPADCSEVTTLEDQLAAMRLLFRGKFE